MKHVKKVKKVKKNTNKETVGRRGPFVKFRDRDGTAVKQTMDGDMFVFDVDDQDKK